jgi:choline dehydrogenase-like flavoprotein
MFNPLFHPDGPTEMCAVLGTKLVVLSAGSFSRIGTLGILERSRIGGKAVLGVDVKQRIDVPGVGEIYQGPSLLHNSYQRLLMVCSVFLCR